MKHAFGNLHGKKKKIIAQKKEDSFAHKNNFDFFSFSEDYRPSRSFFVKKSMSGLNVFQTDDAEAYVTGYENGAGWTRGCYSLH